MASLSKCLLQAGLGEAESWNQELSLSLLLGYQEPSYLSCHLQPPGVHISRKPESRKELTLGPLRTDMACRRLKQHVNHYPSPACPLHFLNDVF